MKNSKYPSKHNGNFCPTISNTAVISVCYQLPLGILASKHFHRQVFLEIWKITRGSSMEKMFWNTVLDCTMCINGLFLLGIIYKEAHICYSVCNHIYQHLNLKSMFLIPYGKTSIKLPGNSHFQPCLAFIIPNLFNHFMYSGYHTNHLLWYLKHLHFSSQVIEKFLTVLRIQQYIF